MENIVFKHENRQHFICEIADHGDVYELRTQNRKREFNCAYFDRNKQVLDAVIAQIETSGHPKCHKNGFTFSTKIDGKTTYICTLAQVVYAAIKQKNISEVSKQCVRFRDGNLSNLRSSNLYQSHPTQIDVVMLSGQKFIRLKTKSALGESKIAITDYDEQLFKILRSAYWCYDETSRGFYTMNTCRKEKFSLALVVFACLAQGATEHDWRDVTLKTRATFHMGEELSIDHKKANSVRIGKYDNRLINLQVMPLELNVLKKTCNRKLPRDCFYIPTKDGALYGKYNHCLGNLCFFRMGCNVSKSDIEGLIHFCKTGDFADGIAYESLPLNSEEAVKIMMEDLREAKLHQEVYLL